MMWSRRGNIRAYPALYLGGTPSQETGTSPPSCLLLENRLYMLYILVHCYHKHRLGKQLNIVLVRLNTIEHKQLFIGWFDNKYSKGNRFVIPFWIAASLGTKFPKGLTLVQQINSTTQNTYFYILCDENKQKVNILFSMFWTTNLWRGSAWHHLQLMILKMTGEV